MVFLPITGSVVFFQGRQGWRGRTAKKQDKKRVSYIYSASIIADPLRTLHSSLVFSGRNEEIDKKPNNNNSIFLYNTAQLYQGMDLNLNGGVELYKTGDGTERKGDLDRTWG